MLGGSASRIWAKVISPPQDVGYCASPGNGRIRLRTDEVKSKVCDMTTAPHTGWKRQHVEPQPAHACRHHTWGEPVKHTNAPQMRRGVGKASSSAVPFRRNGIWRTTRRCLTGRRSEERRVGKESRER